MESNARVDKVIGTDLSKARNPSAYVTGVIRGVANEPEPEAEDDADWDGEDAWKEPGEDEEQPTPGGDMNDDWWHGHRSDSSAWHWDQWDPYWSNQNWNGSHDWAANSKGDWQQSNHDMSNGDWQQNNHDTSRSDWQQSELDASRGGWQQNNHDISNGDLQQDNRGNSEGDWQQNSDLMSSWDNGDGNTQQADDHDAHSCVPEVTGREDEHEDAPEEENEAEEADEEDDDCEEDDWYDEDAYDKMA